MSFFADPRVWQASLAFAVSALFATLLLPLASRLAFATGAVDKPGGRRLHKAPVPRLGGVAVVSATLLACALGGVGAWVLGEPTDLLTAPHTRATVLGAVMIFALGLMDDLRGVSPRIKLLVQAVAAVLVVRSGIEVNGIVFARGLPVVNVHALAPYIAVCWIVVITNAVNLVDGIDGLASVCAIVALATMVVSGLLLHQPSAFLFVAAMLGALVAFVRKNWHPASIFLGDSGSMTIGFLLGVRAIPSATDSSGIIYALVPLAAFCYPLADTLVSVARRWLRGHSFSRADGRHIHHQLVAIGIPVSGAAGLLSLLAAGLSAAALLVSFAPPRMTVALAVGSCLLVSALALYGILRLEYSEFIAFGRAVYSAVTRGHRIVRERIRISDLCERIEDAVDEATVHRLVHELADEHHVRHAAIVDLDELANSRRTRGASAIEREPVVRFECPVRRQGRSMQLRVRVTQAGIENHTLQRIEHMFCAELERWYRRFDDLPESVVNVAVTQAAPEARPTAVSELAS